jgi:novobiocin biosynthesis protein NovU/D-mycarose 3-C-methyltransferase|tara:strand:- start:8739 stop:9968 length:1230 start_codon:yes stop_codon:yes gene_type:complete
MISESKYCRLCEGNLDEITYLCDSPPANNFDETFQKDKSKQKFPLILDYCKNCFNIQLRHCLGEELLYSNYTYVTPKSSSLSDHYLALTEYASNKIPDFKDIDVVEIGSNSGDLLAFLKPHVGSVLGVDPAKNVAKIANDAGVETLNYFFDDSIAQKIKNSKKLINLVIARHMFAHNANPTEMLIGMKNLLNDSGLILIENAYAIDTFTHGEFDQVYHEHMFYYSVKSMENLLTKNNLFLHDIFFSEVHGGSIIFVASKQDHGQTLKLKEQIGLEESLFQDEKIFKIFLNKINEVRGFIKDKISDAQNSHQTIAAYGAPAKAFTMFSLLELDYEIIKFCVDTSPTKIGKVFPISNIPIISEDQLKEQNYDILLVTSWNYKDDILKKASKIFKPGTELIFPLPNPTSVII